MVFSCARGLALLRIGLGLTFIQGAIGLIATGWPADTRPLLSFFDKYQSTTAPGYDLFLQSVAVPHVALFALLVLIGEVFVGLSLTFGLFSRAGAIVCAWLSMNFMLAKGPMTIDATDDRLVFLGSIVVVLTTAEIAWSLDRALRPTLDANPITRWLAGIPAMPRIPIDRLADIRRRPSRAA